MRKSHSLRLAILLGFLCVSVSGCVTDVKHVSYRQTTQQQAMPPSTKSIAVGNFIDNRGEDPSLLCVVKNGYGVVIKRVESDKNVSDVVRGAFVEAMTARGMQPVAGAPLELQGTIDLLGCSYLAGKQFAADISVSVVTVPSRQVVFQQKYVTHHTEGGVGAGILADTDALVRSEQEVISQTIDKALSDPGLLAAIAGGAAPSGMPATSAQSPLSLNERIKKLDELHAQGLISNAEYASKKKELLDAL